MSRMYPRAGAAAEATIEVGRERVDGELKDVSINSAYFKTTDGRDLGRLAATGVVVRARLDDAVSIEQMGRLARVEAAGAVISFKDPDAATRARLWDYILERLRRTSVCPYCNVGSRGPRTECGRCGWMLDFESPGYRDYHEKRLLRWRIYRVLDELDADKLKMALNIMGREVHGDESRCEAFQEFVASSPAMLAVFDKIRKVAPTDIPVLVLGESGTGKELTVIALHERSRRKDGPLVAINCAAIPPNLIESELFGHERGAFTGAVASKKGKFELADGGTLFLDEIGELDLNLQAKLLRFLEDKTIERVGSTTSRKVDVRLAAATNRDLKAAMANGSFRGDLYYRLEAFRLELPPLRERGEDKVLLARYFLNRFACETCAPKAAFTDDAIEAIRAHEWPGNVRELINKVRRGLLLASDGLITGAGLDLPPTEGTGNAHSLKRSRIEHDAERVREALDRSDNNISRAARELGISRPSLYSIIKRYSIDMPRRLRRSTQP